MLSNGPGQNATRQAAAHRTRPSYFLSLLTRSVAGLLLCVAVGAYAEGVRCPVGDIVVVDAAPADVDMVCGAAAETTAYMEALGLRATRPVTKFYLVNTIGHAHFSSSIGAYDAAADRIEILNYDAALKLMPARPAFGVTMNQALYRSFVVHEIAHATANPNFAHPPAGPAHEYIAYTVQLALMDPALRAQVLSNVPAQAFDRLSEVGDYLLMLDPNRFAVMSYRHFVRPENGAIAFEHLLTGDF